MRSISSHPIPVLPLRNVTRFDIGKSRTLRFGTLNEEERNGIYFTTELRLPVSPSETPTHAGGNGEVATTTPAIINKFINGNMSIILAGSEPYARYVNHDQHLWPRLNLKIRVPLRIQNYHRNKQENIEFEIRVGRTQEGVPVYILCSNDRVFSNSQGKRLSLSEINNHSNELVHALPVVNEAMLYLAEALDSEKFNKIRTNGHFVPAIGEIPLESIQQGPIRFWSVNDYTTGITTALKNAEHPELSDVGVTYTVHHCLFDKPIQGESGYPKGVDPYQERKIPALYGHKPEAYADDDWKRRHVLSSMTQLSIYNTDVVIINPVHLENFVCAGGISMAMKRPHLQETFSHAPRKFSMDHPVPAEFKIHTNHLINSPESGITAIPVYKGGNWQDGSRKRVLLKLPAILSASSSDKQAPSTTNATEPRLVQADLGFTPLPISYTKKHFQAGVALNPAERNAILTFKDQNKVAIQKLLKLEQNPGAVLYLFGNRLSTVTKNANLALVAMDRFMATHPDVQFVISYQGGPAQDCIAPLLDQLDRKYPGRFVHAAGDVSIYQLLLASSDFHLMVSNTEPFGTSDSYAAAMGTPNIVSPVDGIATKFSDPKGPPPVILSNRKMEEVLEASGSKNVYDRVKTFGQTALFLKPFDIYNLVNFDKTVIRRLTEQDYNSEILPPYVNQALESINTGLERGYMLRKAEPENYAQLVHNGIQMTHAVFNEEEVARRYEAPIRAAVNAAKERSKARKAISELTPPLAQVSRFVMN